MKSKLFILIVAVATAISTFGQQIGTDSVLAIRPIPALVSTGSTLVINAGLTEIIKNSVERTRPDGSDNNSMPSRHTSWAFAASTAVSMQCYHKYPWVPLSTQLAASIIGQQRVHARQHYGSDVAAGAAIGIASAEVGQIISRLIFGGKSPISTSVAARNSLMVSTTSELLSPLNSGKLNSGFGTSVNMHIPLWKALTLRTTLSTFSFSAPFNRQAPECIAIGLGCDINAPIGETPLALTAGASSSIAHLSHTHNGNWSCLLRAELGFRWHFTEHFAAGMSAGIARLTNVAPTTAITTSISSLWIF